jgi:recombination protein RecA
LKFYASVRLDIRRIGAVKKSDEILGNRTRIKVVKNKLAPPFRSVEVDIMYGRGICRAAEVLDLALLRGVVEKSGAWFSFSEDRLGQGREGVREALIKDAELLAKIETAALKPDEEKGHEKHDAG